MTTAEARPRQRQSTTAAAGTQRGGPAVLAIAGALIALLLQLGFAVSYIGALHNPTPHDLPIGIVAPPPVAAGLAQQTGSQRNAAFSVRSEPSMPALQHAIDQRSIDGGLVFRPRALLVVVADAAGVSAAQALTAFAQGIAATERLPVTIQHVHPLAAGDPRGLTVFYLVLSWVFGAYLCATILSTLRGTIYSSRARAGWRLLLLAGYALLSGVLGAWIAGPLTGAISGQFVPLAAIGMLVVFAVATATMTLQLLLGMAGTLVALVAFVLLGNPASGGIFPAAFLPPFWRAIGPWLPNAAGVSLAQNVLYFGGNGIGHAVGLLAVYAVVSSVLLIALATRRSPRSPLVSEVEMALATAAAAGG